MTEYIAKTNPFDVVTDTVENYIKNKMVEYVPLDLTEKYLSAVLIIIYLSKMPNACRLFFSRSLPSSVSKAMVFSFCVINPTGRRAWE